MNDGDAMLSALADPILPVFFVMALGLIFGKAGIFSEDQTIIKNNTNGPGFQSGMFILSSVREVPREAL